MKSVLKQVLGVDVDQKYLVVSLGRLMNTLEAQVYAQNRFVNGSKGFSELLRWVQSLTDPDMEVLYVMEATGVYHEKLAYYLDQHCHAVSVVLPNKISNYFRTLDMKSINDKSSSEAIALFGLERKLDRWKRPNPGFKKLRQLCRERDQVISDTTLIKNQLHAEQAEAEPNPSSLSRMKKRLVLLNKQEKEIQAEITAFVKQDASIGDRVNRLRTIPGVGLTTAVTVLAETNGFELIRNKRQLTSYAGLDVREKQSGTSVRSKPKISKRGNRYLRKALYMPSLSAIRMEGGFKVVFSRLVSRHGIKMKAVVAIQRKMMELMYVIDKSGTNYQFDYQTSHAQTAA